MAAAAFTAVARPPSSNAPSPTPPSRREGAFREVGTVRHASIHAQRYRLSGTGKVLGGIDVAEGVVEGLLSVAGNVTADRIRSRGTLEVGGDLPVAESLVAQGSLRVEGGLVAGSAELRGISRVGKDVRVEVQLDAPGALEVGGGLSAALFTPKGRFTVGGTLRAREIVGSIVTLRPKAFVRLPINLPPLRPKGSLVVDRIE